MRTIALFVCMAGCAAAAPARIVLVAGNPSHPPGAHEFNAGMMLLEKCLRQNPGVEPVLVKGGWPADEAVFDGAKSIVFYMDGGVRHPIIQMGRLETLQKLMARGVGMAALHYAVEVPKENGGPQLLDWIGGFYERPYSTNPLNDVEVALASPKHAVSKGWKTFSGKDEWYYRIRFRENDKRLTPILTTMLPKDNPNREVIAWVVERAGGGRGFGFTGGHFHSNWGLEDQRRMVVNAILWTAKAKIPRNGANVALEPGDLEKNLDPKPAPKKKQ